LDAVTAQAIVVVGVRHYSVPFLIHQHVDNKINYRLKCSGERKTDQFRPFVINFACENDVITARCTTLSQKNDISIDPGKNDV
jgi:uncharacterized protein (DUF169 family)